MALREYKPVTAGRRGMSTPDSEEITAKKPLKGLLAVKKGAIGRNNQGQITIRHRGGQAKRHYRIMNFKLKPGTTATIEAIEYDPNRSANIARIKDEEGKFHYVLAAKGMRVGRKIAAADDAHVARGNRLPLKSIPVGTTVHAIELMPGKGAQLARSAGVGAQLVAKEAQSAQIRLPSGEVRLVSAEATASIGQVGNEQHQNIRLGKAGRKRHLGIRPTVHGKAMNPADHPMGGGEGKTGPGRIPRTPWGKPAIGLKTRRRKSGSKMIVRSRRQGKRR
jgi:large subunit ribosomal protein L2